MRVWTNKTYRDEEVVAAQAVDEPRRAAQEHRQRQQERHVLHALRLDHHPLREIDKSQVSSKLLTCASARQWRNTCTHAWTNKTYHDGEGRGVHADGEDGGGEAAEDGAGPAVQRQQRHQPHRGEDGVDHAEQAQHPDLGPALREDEEDDHVDGLDHRPRAVDRRHQDVVRGHERQPVPSNAHQRGKIKRCHL